MFIVTFFINVFILIFRNLLRFEFCLNENQLKKRDERKTKQQGRKGWDSRAKRIKNYTYVI